MNARPRLDLVDLASSTLGGRIVGCSDDFFAEAANLLRPETPVWDADRYTDHGKWMDGWESRRRRTPGHDWCVIALGLPGTVEQLVIDTAYFTGNHPEAASVQVTFAPGASDADLLEATDLWTELLPRTSLLGGTEHVFDVEHARTITHVRLAIHPDGGVARLKIRGRVSQSDEVLLATDCPCELAAVDVGGRVLGCSDEYFSSPGNLIAPGPSTGMHDGWETRRRRGPGFDWVALALGRPGRVTAIELDTSFFKGNAPGTCEIQVCDVEPDDSDLDSEPGDGPWRTLMTHTALEAHAAHRFDFDDTQHIAAVRLDIHPDGGVARLRVHGEPAALGELRAGFARFTALDDAAAREALLDCCGSTALADALVAARPLASAAELRRAADHVWSTLTPDDWREALGAHPEIGAAPDDTESRANRWASGEQSGTSAAGDDVLARLEHGNVAYRKRFGYTFVICATDRTPREMAALLERRLQNDPDQELVVAAEEQRRITALRLAKLLRQP